MLGYAGWFDSFADSVSKWSSSDFNEREFGAARWTIQTGVFARLSFKARISLS